MTEEAMAEGLVERLEQLEKSVRRAAETITRLRKERDGLQAKVAGLEAKLTGAEGERAEPMLVGVGEGAVGGGPHADDGDAVAELAERARPARPKRPGRRPSVLSAHQMTSSRRSVSTSASPRPMSSHST